jgi:hypothetical protein
MDSVQLAAERKTVCDNAVIYQSDQSFLDEQEASRQIVLQQNISGRICRWCNESNPATRLATEEQWSMPIGNIIASDVLDQWETDLQGRGYIINRDNGLFTITLE